MNNNPSYFAIIPASVRYDKTLTPNAKLLYGEITALSNAKGYCWATNSYFANLYGKSDRSISEWVSQLEKADHIFIEIVTTKLGTERRIAIDKAIFSNVSQAQNEEVTKKTSGGVTKKTSRGVTKKTSRGVTKKTSRGGRRKLLAGVEENFYHNRTVNSTENNLSSSSEKIDHSFSKFQELFKGDNPTQKVVDFLSKEESAISIDAEVLKKFAEYFISRYGIPDTKAGLVNSFAAWLKFESKERKTGTVQIPSEHKETFDECQENFKTRKHRNFKPIEKRMILKALSEGITPQNFRYDLQFTWNDIKINDDFLVKKTLDNVLTRLKNKRRASC